MTNIPHDNKTSKLGLLNLDYPHDNTTWQTYPDLHETVEKLSEPLVHPDTNTYPTGVGTTTYPIGAGTTTYPPEVDRGITLRTLSNHLISALHEKIAVSKIKVAEWDHKSLSIFVPFGGPDKFKLMKVEAHKLSDKQWYALALAIASGNVDEVITMVVSAKLTPDEGSHSVNHEDAKQAY